VRQFTILLLVVALFCTASAKESPPKGQKLPGSVVAVFKAVNAYRVKNGLSTVKFSGKLVQSAMSHSKEMAAMDYFSHTSPTPGRTDTWDRAELYGYDWAEINENINRSAGKTDDEIARSTVNAWKDSGIHQSNMLDPTVRDIGVGVAQYANGEYAVTVVMGREF
jgi:uncharacterized protein YkwD